MMKIETCVNIETWLIEMINEQTGNTEAYLCPANGFCNWPHHARRFTSEDEAELFRKTLTNPDQYRVAGHLFVYDRGPPPDDLWITLERGEIVGTFHDAAGAEALRDLRAKFHPVIERYVLWQRDPSDAWAALGKVVEERDEYRQQVLDRDATIQRLQREIDRLTFANMGVPKL